jgi:hypothetical protein
MGKEWPGQVPQPHILGNFRERFPEKHKSTFRKDRPGMSEVHCDLLRAMPCCVTLVQPAGTIHHLKSGEAAKERGVFLRATDRWGLPLAWTPHEELERLGSRHERQWFMDRGVDPYDLALSLWLNTGDPERMVNILVAHREHFSKHD